MTASFHIFDWIFLVLYFAGTMGVGAYFYRRTRNEAGFTAGNRALPGWVCGLSIFATFLSSISYLALPGKSFADNWNPFVFSLSIPLVAWIAVKYFLPYYRNSDEVSAYALLEKRFGPWARIYASVFYLLTQIARIGVVLYLMALPMQVIFGWDIVTILIITGICVTLYAFIGGIVAVIWTDAIQAIVLMTGAIVCLILMWIEIPGGPATVMESAFKQDKFSLGSFGLGLGESTFWVVLIYGIVINLQNFGIDQSYVQRYIASSSAQEARKSLWLGALLYVPVSALFFLIGTSLFVYYEGDVTGADSEVPSELRSEAQSTSDLYAVQQLVARQQLFQTGKSAEDPDFDSDVNVLANSLQSAEIGDRVFPHFIATHLPPGLKGLLIAAIFAAAMSTVSTSLNSSATLISNDFYKRFLNPDSGEASIMRVLYAGTIVWGVLGTSLALLLVRLTESALDVWWTLSGILGGGMTGLFLLGRLSKTTKNPAAITGVILGIVVILWLSFPKLIGILMEFPPNSPLYNFAAEIEPLTRGISKLFHSYMVPVFGTLTILLTGIAINKLTTRSAS